MNRVKFLVMAVVAMMTTVSVNAQNVDDEPRNQIAISYGYMSNSNWIDAFENFSEAIVGSRADNETFIGPISVEYFYRLNNPLVNVGAIVAFGLSKEDVDRLTAEEAGFQKYVTGDRLSMVEIWRGIGRAASVPGELKVETQTMQDRDPLTVQVYSDIGDGVSEDNSYFPEEKART